MDAGNNGAVIRADRMLSPRKHAVMIPGPQSPAAKLACEKYFLSKTRNGYVKLAWTRHGCDAAVVAVVVPHFRVGDVGWRLGRSATTYGCIREPA